jgi:hypothetical protein
MSQIDVLEKMQKGVWYKSSELLCEHCSKYSCLRALNRLVKSGQLLKRKATGLRHGNEYKKNKTINNFDINF